MKELTKLVKFAQKHGLKQLKAGDIAFEFSSPPQPKTRAQKPVGGIVGDTERPPTEDEFLFWSTESFDQIRADRTKKESA